MKLLTQRRYYVYLAANKDKTTLTLGSTGDIISLIDKDGQIHSFDKTQVHIVYWECFTDVNQVIKREAEINELSFRKRRKLLELSNPEWISLHEEIHRNLSFP